jgi:hypothetical protein
LINSDKVSNRVGGCPIDHMKQHFASLDMSQKGKAHARSIRSALNESRNVTKNQTSALAQITNA